MGAAPQDAGWRPVDSRVVQQEWRATDPDRYLRAQADFDGDGVVDEARLMIAGDGKTYALLVYPSSLQRQVVLEEESAPFLDVMGISVAIPGTYRTACGKGYWKCEQDEPPEITLTMPGIDYFREASANSFFWWDKKTRSFKRIWISD
jgi:hypothetical protein